MIEISTSILTVEKVQATKTFYDLEVAGTDYYHIDVMDGKFVEKNTEEIMYEYANIIKHISNLPLDVHLMVEDVQNNIDKYIPLNPSIITFHYEACKNDEEVIKFINYIKQNNIKPAISIKPNTSIENIKKFLPMLHMILVMTVEPGKGGQKLITNTQNKINMLKQYIEKNKLDTYIQADGGINKDTISLVKKARHRYSSSR
ncbi:MAG: ribulose-phosphate 3-epimerase [Clostridia bacterium]|nr:ribulose-phosphate 3-epimerase [Clostridia bacterium]